MSRFGRVVNNEMEYAPSTLTDKQTLYSQGYQPVEDTNRPSDYADYDYTYEWQDIKKKFVRVWIRGEKKPDLRPNKEKREEAYETRKCISWEGENLTVDEAVKLWYEYTAEGRDMNALTIAIEEAKNKIREEFPDENSESTESDETSEVNLVTDEQVIE